MRTGARWSIAVALVIGVIVWRESELANRRGLSVTVDVTENGIGGSTEWKARSDGPFHRLRVAVKLRNRSTDQVNVQDVTAVLLDRDGRRRAEILLTKDELLPKGSSRSVDGTLSGNASDALAVGVVTRVLVAGRTERTSRECLPVCTSCDDVLVDRVCQQIFAPGALNTVDR